MQHTFLILLVIPLACAPLLGQDNSQSPGVSLLKQAIENNDLNQIDYLLSEGVDPNSRDSEGVPLLRYALYRNNPELVLRLLAAGAAPTECCTNSHGSLIAYLAVSFVNAYDENASIPHDPQIVELLINHGADVNKQGNFRYAHGFSPLSMAVVRGYVDIVDILLTAGANPNAKYDASRGPIYILALAKDPDIFTRLLSAGAYPGTVGITPLMVAAMLNDTDGMRQLLAEGMNPDAIDKSGNHTALRYAIQTGNYNIASMLLQAGADPNLQYSPAHFEVSPLVITRSEALSLAIESLCCTVLFDAVSMGNTEAITLLLSYNANPNLQNNSGFTPLHLAAHLGNSAAIELLLDAGVDPNIKGPGDITPYDLAIRNGNSNAARIIASSMAE